MGFPGLVLVSHPPRPALPPDLLWADQMPTVIFSGLLLLLGGIGGAAVLTLSPVRGVAAFFLLIVLGAGWALYRSNQHVAQRRAIVRLGHTLRARAIQHERAFSPLKSSRDYVVWVQLPDGSRQRLTHPSVALWQSAPIGAELLGLTHDGHCLFGEELGRRFVLQSRGSQEG